MTVSNPATLSPAEITKRSRSNFSLSFAFLKKAQRRGIAAVYAFCRAADDAVDDTDDPKEGLARLEFWRAELARALGGGEPETQTGRELRWTIEEFGVDGRHLGAVCDGCAMDLSEVSYPDLPGLENYCAHVASAVGLSCLPIFGASEAVAGHYADRLGKALQLTNILRDLRVDAERGRYYAPRDMLAAASVEVEWLDGSGPAEAYVDGGPVHRFVEALSAVAQTRFDEAREALPAAARQRRCLVAAEIMGAVYARLLDRVAERRGRIDVGGRLRVPKPAKIMLALRTWLRGRRP